MYKKTKKNSDCNCTLEMLQKLSIDEKVLFSSFHIHVEVQKSSRYITIHASTQFSFYLYIDSSRVIKKNKLYRGSSAKKCEAN